MWCVPITNVSVGNVDFMTDCLLSQVHGCKCNSCRSLHTPGSPQAGEEVRCGVPRKESPLPSPCFLLYFGRQFFNKYFPQIKRCYISSIASKTGTNQIVNPFTLKDDTHPKCMSCPKGHIHDRQWAKFTTPLTKYDVSIICKDIVPLTQLLMQNSTKYTSRSLMVTM